MLLFFKYNNTRRIFYRNLYTFLFIVTIVYSHVWIFNRVTSNLQLDKLFEKFISVGTCVMFQIPHVSVHTFRIKYSRVGYLYWPYLYNNNVIYSNYYNLKFFLYFDEDKKINKILKFLCVQKFSYFIFSPITTKQILILIKKNICFHMIYQTG